MKWLKMKSVLKDMTSLNAEILLTTELPPNWRSAIEFTDTTLTLYLNAKYAKNVQDIVDSVAHEVTHALNGDNCHEEVHNDWEERVSKTKIDFLRRMGDDWK